MHWLRILTVLALLSPLHCWCEERDARDVQELITGLASEDVSVRGDYIRLLGKLGPEARAAIPELIKCLGDDKKFVPTIDPVASIPAGLSSQEISIRRAAREALADIGLEAVPALEEVLTSQDKKACLEALYALSFISPRARTALNRITPLISSPNSEIARTALRTVMYNDQNGDVAMPLIQQLIQSENEALWRRAVAGLSEYPTHPQTLPILEKAVTSMDPAVRGDAAMVLGYLPGPRDRVVALLLPLLQDDGERNFMISDHYAELRKVRTDAIVGLLQHKAHAEKVYPVLLKMLGDKSPYVAEEALRGLPQISPTPPDAAQHVFKYLHDRIKDRQQDEEKGESIWMEPEYKAVGCLLKLPDQTRALTPKLKELFQSTNASTKLEAAAILAALDPESNTEAVTHVVHAYQRAGDSEQILLIMALSSNDNVCEKLLPTLTEWYHDPDSEWIGAAVSMRQAVQRLGAKAKSAGPALIERIETCDASDAIVALGSDMIPLLISKAKESQNQDQRIELACLQALARFGKQAAPALPTFFESLNSSDTEFRVVVIGLLGELTALPDKIVPELTKRLSDKRCIVRAAAASSLGNFTDRGDVIVPALTTALKDDYADVRASALESLIKLGLDRPGVRDAVRLALQDRHPYVRLLATEALDKAKP